MIIVLCALYPEAEPVIKKLSLKQDKADRFYKKYCNNDNSICLYITGPGPINAATATSYALAENKTDIDDIQIVNFGSCAFLDGNVKPSGTCLCSKIVNIDSGRTFYPDMLLKSSLDEATIVTGSRIYEKKFENGKGESPVSNNEGRTLQTSFLEETDPSLYDMEAAAIYETASHFVGPHQMHFLKYITDEGDGSITPELVRTRAQESLDDVVEYLKALELLVDDLAASDLSDGLLSIQDRLIEDLHASFTMQHQIHQLLRYADIAGIDFEKILTKLYDDDKLPCRDKRQGLKVLEEVRAYIDGSTEATE